MIDRLTARLAERSIANQRALVDDHPRARRLMLRELVTFVIVLAALVIRPAAAGMLSALVIVVVGFYVGASALSATRRAHAYRSGWLDGRARMIDALREAMQRGHTLEDWIGGELARDYAALGVDPTRENEREGGDDEAP